MSYHISLKAINANFLVDISDEGARMTFTFARASLAEICKLVQRTIEECETRRVKREEEERRVYNA